MDDAPLPRCDAQRLAFDAVAGAFGSLGRVCLALDRDFLIRHASPGLDSLLGPGAAARHALRPVEELLGPELFGPAGPLRAALIAGERREGWRAWLRAEPSGTRLVSLTAAPLHHVAGACDPDAAYLVVLRSAEQDESTRSGAPSSFAGAIARSRQMLRVLRKVESLQQSDITVLITGESGVGKGVIAQAIHRSSLRRDGPFVAVNCAALPETLLESELFGHVRGAFTGAVRDRVGRFEMAAGGTVFLDEVGELPLHLQAKLLRVCQERVFERVGDSRSIAVDVRVIAATHRALRLLVQEKRFREDLYYRLRVFPIELPPLRERREDIEPLARYLLGQVGARSGRSLRFSPEALRALLVYSWPGNVRELENALEYAVTTAPGQTLQPEDLPPEVLEGTARAEGDALEVRHPPAATAPPGDSATPPPHSLDERRTAARRDPPAREQLVATLELHRWRMTEASRALGVSRTTLWRWMREARVTR